MCTKWVYSMGECSALTQCCRIVHGRSAIWIECQILPYTFFLECRELIGSPIFILRGRVDAHSPGTHHVLSIVHLVYISNIGQSDMIRHIAAVSCVV